VDSSTLEQCQNIIGHVFRDPALLELALTHSSVAPTRTQSNERLEFLGDSVLGLVVCERLYQTQDEMMEGEMTKVKSLVVSREICSEVAVEAGIDQLLYLGKGLARGGALPTSISAAVFESIVGAIYLDAGYQAAREFVLRHMQPHIDGAIADGHRKNYKSLLQQHAQRVSGSTPEYVLLDEKGPEHNKCFEVSVSVAGRHYPSAWGTNKKQAEQRAARRALIELGVLAPTEPEEDGDDADE